MVVKYEDPATADGLATWHCTTCDQNAGVLFTELEAVKEDATAHAYTAHGATYTAPADSLRRMRDEKIKDLADAGLTHREIAETVGMSSAGLYETKKRLGVTTAKATRGGRRDTELLELHAQGLTRADIARATGLSHTGITDALRRLGAIA